MAKISEYHLIAAEASWAAQHCAQHCARVVRNASRARAAQKKKNKRTKENKIRSVASHVGPVADKVNTTPFFQYLIFLFLTKIMI